MKRILENISNFFGNWIGFLVWYKYAITDRELEYHKKYNTEAYLENPEYFERKYRPGKRC